jgi:hypothetical protein
LGEVTGKPTIPGRPHGRPTFIDILPDHSDRF